MEKLGINIFDDFNRSIRLVQENATAIIDGMTQINEWLAKTFNRILDGSFNLQDISDLFNLPAVRDVLAFIKPFMDEVMTNFGNMNNVIKRILNFFEPTFSITS